MLVNATKDVGLSYQHIENKFIEFNREALIPHMLSSEGPAVAVGDLNADGLDDIFLGGAKWKRGHVYLQTLNGKFVDTVQPEFALDSTFEDVGAELLDAESDGDLDLVVASGGNEFTGKSTYRKSRLYLNDGKGRFSKSHSFPDIFATASCVVANDVDGDGDQDLFIGTRALPWHYGVKADSYILINDGKGAFKDETDRIAPALKKFGFVKHASWVDVDGDKVKDLVLAAEWSPITILLSKDGKLSPMKIEGTGLENTEGWWNIVQPADVDNDGDMDFIAGNLGLNSKIHASVTEPVRMFVADFDKNDSIDQVVTHFIHGKEYPFHTRDEMTKQLPYLKKRYLSYRKFADATVFDMFNKEVLDKSEKYVANTFETCFIENLGNGKFKVKRLPNMIQMSTVNALLFDDFNGDKNLDVLVAGNFYRINIQMGRYDASYGTLLLGDGTGNFKTVPPAESGFSVKGETRHLAKVKIGGKDFYLAVRNNDTVEAFKLRK